MTPTPQIIDFISAWEGCCLKPYEDVAGKWTVGYGHLLHPDEDRDPITQQEAVEILSFDLSLTADSVDALVDRDLEAHQFDALISLVFNIGAGAFKGSTLRNMLNMGFIAHAASQFERWNKARIVGKLVPVAGLTKRRKAEKAIFLNADYSGRP